MKVFPTRRFAINGLLTILSLVVVFHLLVMTGVVPYGIVWGGNLKEYSQMLTFEAVSIVLNLVMLAVVAVYAGMLKVKVNPLLIRIAIWIMFALFLINTVGNIFSKNEMERIIFTPITLVLSIFCLRLATSQK